MSYRVAVSFLLTRVQPALSGLMDGSLSTLATHKHQTIVANPPAPEVIAAQKAFNDALRRYNTVVAALVKPAID